MNWARSSKAMLAYPVVLGVLWGLAYPKWGVAGLAWVVPGGVMTLALLSTGSAFRVGYLTGFAAYLVSLSWLLYIPFPAGAAGGWIALSAYLALYPALWAWFCQYTVVRWMGAGTAGGTVDVWGAGAGRWCALLNVGWVRRSVWMLVMAASWVAWEMAVGRMLTGFPWLFLGMTQYEIAPLIQVASVTGIYGVSFLAAWFSLSLATAVGQLLKRPDHRWHWVSESALPLTLLLVVVVNGFVRLTRPEPMDRTLSMVLVQPSIPQELIWDEREDDRRFDQLMELSRLALETRPELLVWPEAALPSITRANYDQIREMISEHGVWMILGADDVEPRVATTGKKGYDAYNSAFLFGPDGAYRAGYRKQRLVIFGEYVPLSEWLPFLYHLTPIQGSFKPGAGPEEFHLAELDVDVPVLICFEDVFPHGARQHVSDQTDFLLNLTNNGWFGESAAQWQHAANGAFRAVENGVPLVRCTNNGLTCWIDAKGRMRQVFRQEGDEYARGYFKVDLPLGSRDGLERGTFYRRHGDVFGWSCVGIAIAGAFVRRRNTKEVVIK